MTTGDLGQQRSMRRAATMEAEAKLSTQQLGITASPSLSAKSPKPPSRLESMRSALGLNKTTSGVAGKSGTVASASTAAAAAAVDPLNTPPRPGGSSNWTLEGPVSPTLPPVTELPGMPDQTLRSQFSNRGIGDVTAAGRSTTSFGRAPEAQGGDKTSPWGAMFSKKY